ncbi:MAG: hypothetical protein F6K19_48490 [Cyanothece sp. SIO1E1]|nr:hypothetical protein [Cyanothece sp. SIO1E1]
MMDSELQIDLIPVDLGEGVIVQVKVIETGREKVSAGTLPFDSVAKAISKISQVVAAPIQAVKPTKLDFIQTLGLRGKQQAQ